ncbi:MAG: 6-phosphogluconolactonase [Sphaerochaetaceae bacterium]
MELLIQKDALQVDRYVAMCMAAQILRKPESLLSLATGNTTESLYRVFIEMAQQSSLDVSKVKASVVDEYAGISPQSPLGCRYRLVKLFVDAGLLDDTQLIGPQSKDDREAFAMLLSSLGPFDLQVLGVGTNGHLGFNEPGCALGTIVDEVTLTESTRKVLEEKYAQRGIHEPIPQKGITMGMPVIMQSKEILLVAKGREKADVVQALITGPVGSQLPASLLQLHPNCKVVLDQGAASKLP